MNKPIGVNAKLSWSLSRCNSTCKSVLDHTKPFSYLMLDKFVIILDSRNPIYYNGAKKG